MKKSFLFSGLIILSFLSGCHSPNSLEELLFLLTDIKYEKKCDVIIYQNDDVIYDLRLDNLSYRDNLTGITYCSYVFKDGYQKYNDIEIIDSYVNIDINYGEILFPLVNSLLFNENNFIINDTSYILKEESFGKFSCSLFEGTMEGLEVIYQKGNAKYFYNYQECDYIIEFSKVSEGITYFNENYENKNEFYEDNMISSYQEILRKKTEEDYILIITSNDCSACVRNESLYYSFAYENDCLKSFYAFDVDNFKNDEKLSFGRMLKEAYSLKQNEIFRHQEYEEYPETLLTPTAIRFFSNKIRYVLPGFSEKKGELFYNFCFE